MAASSQAHHGVTDEQLMELVQTFPCIYNKRRKDYIDSRVKQNAWKAIADQLQIDPSEARTKYDVVRIRFSRYLKSVKAIKSGYGLGDLKIKEEHVYCYRVCMA